MKHLAVPPGGRQASTQPPAELAKHPHGAVLALDIINVMRYYAGMIASFADQQTVQIFNRQRAKRPDVKMQKIALRKLRMIDAAAAVDDLRVPPGNRLERLKGDRRGQYSIRINQQWRICFRWAKGAAHDVQITDYHG